MKTNVALLAVAARVAMAQEMDFAAILAAPTPSELGPPLDASSAAPSVVNSAAVAASISNEVTAATASVTGAAASAASTEDPSAAGVEKRFWFPWNPKTTMKTSTKQSTTQAPVTTPTPPATTTSKQGTTTTGTSTSACPTTPEDGTYCGFINPEDACAKQPDGYGPKVQPDTVEAFRAYPEFHADARNAVTPSGYKQVFEDLNATVSANSYITFYTLQSYDVSGCAKHCDDTDLCTAFNIYIERDPSLNPTKNDTDPEFNCPNPSSITNYKCSLWGSSISEEDATNEGGYRGDFQVVIVGSNGYDKTDNTTPPQPPNYNPGNKCPGGAISAGGKYHVGSKFFPGPFNPSLCSTYADAQSAKNKQQAQRSMFRHFYTPVNFFNAYMVNKNGHPQGTYCSLYDVPLNDKWCSYTGGQYGGDQFDVKDSWCYSAKHQDIGWTW